MKTLKLVASSATVVLLAVCVLAGVFWAKRTIWPEFAKSNTGYLALQGDHGEISFRNIKIRAVEPRK